MTIKRHPAVVAPVGGVLLGVLDFLWIKYVPFPLGGLGNSPAIWAVAAFLLPFLMRATLPAGLASAVTLLVVAVPSYYVAATVVQQDALANTIASPSLLWMASGVVAGVVFGGAGVLARRPGRLAAVAAALPSAVLLAEAALQARRLGDPSYQDAETLQYGGILALLAVLVAVLVTRTWPGRVRTLALAAPLAAAGCGLMLAAGFR